MKFVAFGDVHLDHSNYGKMSGGIPVRILDTYNNLKDLVNFSIENDVDYVFFTGDMYRTNHPSQRYRAMVEREIAKLSEHGIKVVMITGNHDVSPSAIAEHALSEFKYLRLDNVWLVDTSDLLLFDDIQVACIAWDYNGNIPEFELEDDLPSLCIGHCTTWGETPFWETDSAELTLGRDYFIPLDYFDQFDYTVLGHIHKPTFWEKVCYPGSMERNTWGEMYDIPQGFIYYDGEINHIPYKLRPRVKVYGKFPKVDSETMYRVFTDDVNPVHTHFRNAFYVDTKPLVKKSKKRDNVRDMDVKNDMTETDWLQLYLGDKYAEVEDLWIEILQNN